MAIKCRKAQFALQCIIVCLHKNGRCPKTPPTKGESILKAQSYLRSLYKFKNCPISNLDSILGINSFFLRNHDVFYLSVRKGYFVAIIQAIYASPVRNDN